MAFLHPQSTVERWPTFSFEEKMGNLGAEIARAKNWEQKGDKEYRDRAIGRALELVDLTLATEKTFPRLKEVARLREVLCDIFAGTKQYQVSLQDLENYCLPFAIAARKGR